MVNRMTIDLRIEGSKIKMASDGHESSSGIPLSRLVLGGKLRPNTNKFSSMGTLTSSGAESRDQDTAA